MTNTETLPNQPVDVFIAGGGLAGLTLALQLKQARPETSIIVAEKGKHPAPNAAFKVGESSLDGASHYLGEVLGLKEYLQTEHLLKPGFRFFTRAGDNQDIVKRFELATIQNWDPAEGSPSYQLDRGKLETKLGEEARRHGVCFWDECTVRTLDLDAAGPHRVTVVRQGTETQLHARWVIDASGVTSTLRRQLNLNEEIDHNINAAWFRVNKIITVQDWADDPEWQARFAAKVRRLATCHLTGKGYWVWLIPLSGDLTSVGIVADNRLHPFEQFNRRERALEWLAKHEPQCAQAVADGEMLDFGVLKHFAHGCKQVFSSERWAITGVAGAFSDPLYSPGSELITVSNTIITDTICRDLAGEAIAERVDFFNDFYLNFVFDTVLRDVKEYYPMLDSSLVVTVKKLWQMVWYFSILVPLVFNQQLTDIEYLTLIQAELARFQTLHQRVQALCQELYAQGPHRPAVDYIAYVFRLKTLQQIVLKKPSDDSAEARRELLRYNLSVIESFITSLSQQLNPPTELSSDLSPNVQADIVAEFNDFWRAWQPVAA
ncbi:MAG: NAD(P)/FAD-dependent oxidoreductase [Chloroflexi bacterium]|nr:NAD(P)/FAD-dependent oxidoreductase [Chloroflexota bacterium]